MCGRVAEQGGRAPIHDARCVCNWRGEPDTAGGRGKPPRTGAADGGRARRANVAGGGWSLARARWRLRRRGQGGCAWKAACSCSSFSSSSVSTEEPLGGVGEWRQRLTSEVDGSDRRGCAMSAIDAGCKPPDFHRKPESLYHRDSPWISGYRVQNISQINTQSHTSHHIEIIVHEFITSPLRSTSLQASWLNQSENSTQR
jgi:hypothetical protein